MRKTVAVYGVLWLLAWCLGWGGFYLMLSHGVDYCSQPGVTALYFAAATVVVAFLSRGLVSTYLRTFRLSSLLAPGLALAVAVAVYAVLPRIVPPPMSLALRNPDMFFLHADPGYLVSKPFDISFQQTLVLLLVLLLRQSGLSVRGTCGLCCLLFGAPHLYLVAQNGTAMGGYFLCFSLTAGLLFPYMILRLRRGLSYTFSLHVLFYVFTGALCWLMPSVLL